MRRSPLFLAIGSATTVLLFAAMVYGLGTRAPSATLPELTTQIAIMNPGKTTLVAQVNYLGVGGSCDGKRYVHGGGPQAVLPGSMFVFDQGPSDKSGLPDGCNATASISVTRGTAIGVVLSTQTSATGGILAAAAYDALRPEDGSTEISLPMWRNRTVTDQRTTLIQAMNVSDSTAKRAVVHFLDENGKPVDCTSPACDQSIQPGSAATWWPSDLPEIAKQSGTMGILGSARVSADLPLAAVALDVSEASNSDMTAYDGLIAEDRRNLKPLPVYQPLVLRRGASRLAGRAVDATSPEEPLGIQGAGVSWLRLVNLDPQTSTDIVTEFYKQSGGPPVELLRPDVSPWGVTTLQLVAETALSNGAYAARGSARTRLGAVAVTEWLSSGGAVAGRDALADTQVGVPYVVKEFKGQSSMVSIQNTNITAQSVVTVTFTPEGDRTPSLSKIYSIAPGTSMTLDLARDQAFLELPANSRGAMWVSADHPVAVSSLVDFQNSQRAVAAFEGVPADHASDVLLAPLVHASFVLKVPDQPTPTDTDTPIPNSSATPTPTEEATKTSDPDTATPADTLEPGETPTATWTPTREIPEITLTPLPTSAQTSPSPTAQPTLGPRKGWSRPLGDFLGAGDRVRVHAIAPDGSIWVRITSASDGPDRVVVLHRGGRPERYGGLRAAIERLLAEIRRHGTLPRFWAVDGKSRPWIGPVFFDGATWNVVARDEPQLGGGLRYAEQALLDRDGRAWVPVEGQLECPNPPECGTNGLRAFDEAGKLWKSLSFAPMPEAGRYGVPEVVLMPRRAGATQAKLDAWSGLNLDGSGLDLAVGGSSVRGHGVGAGPDRLWAVDEDWAVTRRAMYSLPDGKAVYYPFLDNPSLPPSGGLRNVGYFTAALRRPVDGALQVFTWVERMVVVSGQRRLQHRIYLNTWLGTAWATPEDLTGGPLFPDDPSHDPARNDRVTAAAYTGKGTLWIGTAQGRAASRKFGQWDAVMTKDNSPLVEGQPITAISAETDGQVCFSTDTDLLCFADGESQIQGAQIYVPRLYQWRAP